MFQSLNACIFTWLLKRIKRFGVLEKNGDISLRCGSQNWDKIIPPRKMLEAKTAKMKTRRWNRGVDNTEDKLGVMANVVSNDWLRSFFCFFTSAIQTPLVRNILSRSRICQVSKTWQKLTDVSRESVQITQLYASTLKTRLDSTLTVELTSIV